MNFDLETLIEIKKSAGVANSGGHMNYPADSTAKLCQGGKGRYVGREGVPVDNCSREKCEPVIVFESLDLSVC